VRRAEGNYIAYTLKNIFTEYRQLGRGARYPDQRNRRRRRRRHSRIDGAMLRVEVTVADSSGKTWYTRNESLASKYAYDPSVPADIDPFQAIYREISDDMLAYRQTLQPADVTRIRTVAEMKFAREFAPDAFASYLTTNSKGQVEIKRLPA
jgi:hypothetical protein